MNSMESSLTGYTEVFTWGSDSSGQMGLAGKKSGKNYPIPRFCSFNVVINSISCGEEHSAFIASNGCIYTMGSNADGRLGISSRTVKNSSSPCLVEALSQFRAIKVSCGSSHTTAILESGELFTWGFGSDGQLGLGNTQNHHSPQLVAFPKIGKSSQFFIVDVSAGAQHTVALSDQGDIFVFGSSELGQLGTGRADKELLPSKIDLYNKVKEIACGPYHTIILCDTGRVYATGNNSHGQLGLGTKKSSLSFQKVSFHGDQQIKRIASGSHSCAITDNGQLYLWGTGSFGEFLLPQKITGFKSALFDISVGSGFGLAIDTSGNAYSWGSNKNGELGLGDYEPRFVPTQISALQGKKVTSIACGNNFVIGLGITIFHKSDEQSSRTRLVEEKVSMRKYSVDEQPPREILREDSRGFEGRRERSIESSQRAELEKKSYRTNGETMYKSNHPRTKKESTQIYTSYNEDYRRRSNASSPVREERFKKEENIYKTMDHAERFVEEDSSDRYYLPPRKPVHEDGFGSKNHSIQMNMDSKIYREENSQDYKLNTSKRNVEHPRHQRKSSQPDISKSYLNETRDFEGSRRFSSTNPEGILELPLKKEPKRSSSLAGILEEQPSLPSQNNNYKRESFLTEHKRNSRNEILVEENERLIRENVHMDNENTNLRAKIKELEEKLSFKEKVEEVNYHEKMLTRKNEKMEGMYRELEAKYKDTEFELQREKEISDNLRKDLTDEKAQNSKLVKALEDNHKFMKALEEENKELLEKQSQLNEAYDYCKERDFYKRKLEEVQKKFEKKSEEYEIDMKEKENMIDKLNEEISAANSAISELNEALKQLTRNQDKERNVLTQCEKDRDKYYDENQQLRNELDVLVTKLEKLESHKENTKIHNDEKFKAYNQMLVEKEEEINNLERSLRKLNNDHQDIQEKNNSLEKIIENQRREIEHSREEIKSLHEKSMSKSELKTLTTVVLQEGKKIPEIDESHISPCETPDNISRTDELVSILKKESKGLNNSKLTGKRGKSVAFDIEEKSYSNPNSFDLDSFINSKQKAHSTRSSPTRFEKKVYQNRSYESPKKYSYESSPEKVRGRSLNGAKQAKQEQNKENFDSGSAATLTSYISVSERGQSAERVEKVLEKIEPSKPIKIHQINESANKLAELLNVDKKGSVDSLERKKKSLDIFSDENSEPFQYRRIKPHTSEEDSSRYKKPSEPSMISDNYTSISLSNQDSGSHRDNKASFEEKGVLSERQENETEKCNISTEDSNLDNLKTKLQDLQKNKMALEQRMQDFEKRLKESKKKA